jgi:hypothetical protein
MRFALPPHRPRPRLRAAPRKAGDCFAHGGQNRSSVPALGNLGIEGTTDLARENLIAAVAFDPPAVRAVASDVYTAVTSTRAFSIDHLVSAQPNRKGYLKTKRRGGLAVHDHLELSRKLHWKIARLLAAQDAI